MAKVLVTGGTGFVGSHAVAELLKQGHSVRTTIRDIKRKFELITMLRNAGVNDTENLQVFAAVLENDTGWQQAVAGCEFVHHIASPFPAGQFKDEQEIIRPAVEGTLRVLRFARQADVHRVVMTSSFAAIGYGHEPDNAREFTESDWTNLSAPLPPYIKSKTLAEQAAWKFIREHGNGMEFTSINPTGIFGPILGHDYSASILLIKQMIDGKMPGVPRIYFGAVDVRDVVDMHLRAMREPRAVGERFIAASGAPLSMLQVAQILRRRLGADAQQVPTKQLPDWLLRILALINPKAKQAVPDLGRIRAASNQKARTILGWSPRTGEEAVVASAESLLRVSNA